MPIDSNKHNNSSEYTVLHALAKAVIALAVRDASAPTAATAIVVVRECHKLGLMGPSPHAILHKHVCQIIVTR